MKGTEKLAQIMDLKPKTSTFFLILNYKTSRVFKGFEQLSCSFCCQGMAGQIWSEKV